MSKNYDEASVLKSLAKKGCSIDRVNNTITFNPDGQCGNSTFGKMDFLSKHCGWHIVKSKSVPVKTKTDNDEPKVKNNKK